MSNSKWSVAGLCVMARPEDLDAVEVQLGARPELEVHAKDHDSGRLVVVQECSSVKEHRRNLEEIQALPGVLTADLVVHYADPDGDNHEQITGGVS